MSDGSIAKRELSHKGSILVDLAIIAGTMAAVIVVSLAMLVNEVVFAINWWHRASPVVVLAHLAMTVVLLSAIVGSVAVIIRSTVTTVVDSAIGVDEDQRFAELATRVLRVVRIVASATVIGLAAADRVQPGEASVALGSGLVALGVVGLATTVRRTRALLEAYVSGPTGWPWARPRLGGWGIPRRVLAEVIASLTDLSHLHRHDVVYVAPSGPHGGGVIPDQHLPLVMNARSAVTADDQFAYLVELTLGHCRP